MAEYCHDNSCSVSLNYLQAHMLELRRPWHSWTASLMMLRSRHDNAQPVLRQFVNVLHQGGVPLGLWIY